MRTDDLLSPFSFPERHLLVRDGVFFLPDYLGSYDGFFPELPLNGEVFIEFCSGNGEWILDKALKNPDKQFFAVEKQFFRVRKIFRKREQRGIKNLFIVCGDAQLLLTHFLPHHSIDTIAVNFPDPWPKERHQKHRLFQPKFMQELKRVLKPEGGCFVVTDDAAFSSWVSAAFLEHHFIREKVNLLEKIPDYGSSFFMRLWEEKGKSIFYHHYTKGP